MKGCAIGNSDNIRQVHNSFARPEPFMVEDDKKSGEGEAFHFISYVPYRGMLYELDGLQKGPIEHGECTKENWLQKAQVEIQNRISQHEGSEIRFVLMSLGQSLVDKYTAELAECNAKKEELEAAVTRGGEEGANAQALLRESVHVMQSLTHAHSRNTC